MVTTLRRAAAAIFGIAIAAALTFGAQQALASTEEAKLCFHCESFEHCQECCSPDPWSCPTGVGGACFCL